MSDILHLPFLVLCIGLYNPVKCQNPHSCADIYKSNILQSSGVFTIYNRQQQPFQVYCDFKKGFGYTYIYPNVSVNVNIDDLYTNRSHVIIRDLRKDGTQRQSIIQQISAFKATPLSIQFNSSTGYQSPLNTKMSPYIYIGIIPKNLIRRGQVEGFNTNGHNAVYKNCDGNANSYFTFLFNRNGATEVNYSPTPSMVAQLRVWDSSLPSSLNIPQSFFTPFEFHFGGCGGYGDLQDFPTFQGAAVGLRYDITCPKPDDVPNAQYSSSGTAAGSMVTYTCDDGYTITSGSETRTCAQTGKWTGVKPVCGNFPCESSPCQHFGKCIELSGSTYECHCVGGYFGPHCEYIII